MRRLEPAVQLLAPLALIGATAVIGAGLSASRQLEFENALVKVAIVVALYVFIGNSGVISFGQISFVAVGAYISGILTLDVEQKNVVLPSLYSFLRTTHVGTFSSLALAAAAGGLYAFLVGLPLMRLSGLPAGIATFAVLGITYNVLYYWEKVSPAAQRLASVPEVGTWTVAVGSVLSTIAAFLYQRSRQARQLRATREDPGAAQAAGIDIYRQRLLAFTLSGALAGFAGGLLVHQAGSIAPGDVYLDLTFLTLAMLVIGGATSLLGAVVGALLISAVDSFLGDAENTVHLFGHAVKAHEGTRLVTLGALMALVLLLRPGGITGGRELGIPRRGPARRAAAPSDKVPA
jgi:branched-chain amino acid transport system permease protein